MGSWGGSLVVSHHRPANNEAYTTSYTVCSFAVASCREVTVLAVRPHGGGGAPSGARMATAAMTRRQAAGIATQRIARLHVAVKAGAEHDEPALEASRHRSSVAIHTSIHSREEER